MNRPSESTPVIFATNVLAAAERVLRSHDERLAAAQHAQREWERLQTMSSAVRRDNARAALLALSDAYTVALAVRKATAS